MRKSRKVQTNDNGSISEDGSIPVHGTKGVVYAIGNTFNAGVADPATVVQDGIRNTGIDGYGTIILTRPTPPPPPVVQPPPAQSPLPPGPLDPLDAFVRALYIKVLHRRFDAPGLAFWVGELRAGMSRSQVAVAFETSPEGRGVEVDRFYVIIFGRPADAVGRAGWGGALASGQMSEAQVVAALLTSAEYAAAHGDPAAFITGVFLALLGRGPSAGDVSFYLPTVQAPGGRAQLVLIVLGSQEAFLSAIRDDYGDLLGRAPDPAGLLSWLAAINAGKVTPVTFAAGFLASDEFFARAPAVAAAGP